MISISTIHHTHTRKNGDTPSPWLSPGAPPGPLLQPAGHMFIGGEKRQIHAFPEHLACANF
eukprot:396943-Rhodomonas_salina.2